MKQEIILSIDPSPSELDRIEAIEDQVQRYAGHPRQVWGGWVWVVGSNEQRWSKRPTYSECIEVVYEVVERLGEEDAFDLYVNEEVQS